MQNINQEIDLLLKKLASEFTQGEFLKSYEQCKTLLNFTLSESQFGLLADYLLKLLKSALLTEVTLEKKKTLINRALNKARKSAYQSARLLLCNALADLLSTHCFTAKTADDPIEILRLYQEALTVAEQMRSNETLLQQQKIKLQQFEVLFLYYTCQPLLLHRCHFALQSDLTQFEILFQAVVQLGNKLCLCCEWELAKSLYRQLIEDWDQLKEKHAVARDFDESKWLRILTEIDQQQHKSDVTIYSESENYRKQLAVLRTNTIEPQRQNKTIREIQIDITHGFQQLLSQMIEDAIAILGSAPCQFVFIGFGSYSRQEMLPYSDLEFALLIEKTTEFTNPYFKALLRLLYFKIESLGESNPQNNVGFHLDEAVRPEKDTRLYGTPAQLADTLFDDKGFPLSVDSNQLTNNLVLSFSLLKPALLYGDEYLLNEYQTKVKEHLYAFSKFDDIPCHQQRALLLLQNKIADFEKRNLIAKSIWNIKEDFIESLSHPCLILALYMGIAESNCNDVLDALVHKKFFSEKFGKLYKSALRDLQELRLRVQMHYGSATEKVKLPNTVVDDSDITYTLKPSELLLLQLVARVLLESFYIDLHHFLKKPYTFQTFNSIENYYQTLEYANRGMWLDELKNFIAAIPQDDIFPPISFLAEIKILAQHLMHIPDQNGYRQSERLTYEKLILDINTISLSAETETTKVTTNIQYQAWQGLTVALKIPMPGKIIERVLPLEVVAQLIDPTTGHLIHANQENKTKSRHHVIGINHQGCQLHFKERPDHPGMDYTIYLLRQRLFGHGAPPNILAKLTVNGMKFKNLSYPVLISSTCGENNLKQWFAEHSKQNFQINPKYYSELALFDLFTYPGDGASRNYQVIPLQTIANLAQDTTIHALSCVDNDQHFVEPIIKTWHTNQLQVRSILFCLPQMHQPIPTSVLEAFAQLHIDSLLYHWLEDISQQETIYTKLFEENEITQLYTEDPNNPVTPYILFREGTITQLAIDLIFLQGQARVALQTGHPPSIFDLMQKLNLRLASYYQKVLEQLSLTPEQRFDQVTKQARISVTSRQALQASLGEIPKEEEIKHQKRFSPKQAIKELGILSLEQFSNSILIIQQQNSVNNDFQKYELFNVQADFKSLVLDDQNTPNLKRQTLILRALSNRSFYKLVLNNCAALDDDLLANLLSLSSQLTYLDIRYCQGITDKAIRYIAQQCPQLEALYLSGNASITELIDYFGLIAATLLFPKLQILHTAHCDNLVSINIKAPELIELKANDCKMLRDIISLNAPQLQKVNFSHCINLTEQKFILGLINCTQLLCVKLTSCINIKNRDVLEKIPKLLKSYLRGTPSVLFINALRDIINNTTDEIDLRATQIDDEDAHLFASVLQTNTCVSHIDFGYNKISDQGSKSLAAMLENNTTLTSINLSHNEIAYEGLSALVTMLKINHSLRSIDLSYNKTDSNGITQLINMLRTNKTLTSLELEDSDIEDKEAILLAETLKINNTLLNLNLGINNIGDTVATAFAEMLATNTTLNILNLSNNKLRTPEDFLGEYMLKKISNDGATKIATMLDINSTLNSLNLSYHNIGDEGLRELMLALKTNRFLTYLGFEANRITIKGISNIATMLLANNTLTSINLDDNDIGDAGLKVLTSGLIENTTLQSLSVGHNNIGDSGVKALVKVLETNNTLTFINLSYNEIRDKGIKEFSKVLQTNSALTSLNLKGNRPSHEALLAFATLLQGNYCLTWVNLDFDKRYSIMNYNKAKEAIENIQQCLVRNQQLCDQFHQAVQQGDLTFVQQNLSKVSLLSFTGKQKNAPFHWAAQNGHTEIIKLLLAAMLEKRQPIWVKNQAGKTALQLAKENNHLQIVTFLEPYCPSTEAITTKISSPSLPKLTFSEAYQRESVHDKSSLIRKSQSFKKEEEDNNHSSSLSKDITSNTVDSELQQAIVESLQEQQEQEYKLPSILE